MILAADFVKQLHLTVLSPSTKEGWELPGAETNRPGMQFCGYYTYFASERPQVIGKVEMTYLNSLSPESRAAMLKTYFAYDLPCVICCRGLRPPDELIEAAAARDIPVYLSEEPTTRFTYAAINYLSQALAPRTVLHGVLMDVYGVGVLITGESGVGKSETALELIKRGHALVADDVVEVRRVSETRLVGECPEMVRHLMEIRGVGIIDIRAMFGVGAVESSKSIDLIIHLEPWEKDKDYDRIGLEEHCTELLGVRVVEELTPVKPGRNLAIIVEVAARNLSLKRMGLNAAEELERRYLAAMSRGFPEDAP